jgi:hypothetical protein
MGPIYLKWIPLCQDEANGTERSRKGILRKASTVAIEMNDETVVQAGKVDGATASAVFGELPVAFRDGLKRRSSQLDGRIQAGVLRL